MADDRTIKDLRVGESFIHKRCGPLLCTELFTNDFIIYKRELCKARSFIRPDGIFVSEYLDVKIKDITKEE